MTAADIEDDAARAGRARWRGAVLRGTLVGLAIWFGVAVVLVLSALLAAQRGRDSLEEVAESIELRDLLDTDSSLLDEASDHFGTANDRFRSPIVAPLRWVPVLGRQLQTAGALTDAADELLRASAVTLDVVAEERDAGLDSGARRLAFLSTARRELDGLSTAIAGLDLGPRSALFGPVAEARVNAQRRLDDLAADVDDARAVIGALVDVLEGSQYLVLAANNAEMRVGSGMFLSIGPVAFEQGAVSVGEFVPASELVLIEPVPLPAEIEQLWGFASPATEWRNLGLTARFPVNAEMAAAMWEANGYAPVDGVMSIDVVGLELLLGAIGPIEVGDRTIGADDVGQILLHDQYIGVEDDDSNAARREQLAPIAGAVVRALGGGGIDLVELFEAFRDMQRGRHLMVWSADAAQQRSWETLHVDGDLGDRSLLVGVANAGGTKLDQFLDVDASIVASPRSTDRRIVDVELEVIVANRAPPDEPAYILAPDGSATYTGFVVIQLPGSAGEIALDDGGVVASGPDGPTQVVAVALEVPRRSEKVVRFRFALPASIASRLDVVASARVPPTRWTHGEDGFLDRIGRTLRLIDR